MNFSTSIAQARAAKPDQKGERGLSIAFECDVVKRLREIPQMMTSTARRAQYVRMFGQIAWRTSLIGFIALFAATTAGLGAQLESDETVVAVEILNNDTLILDTSKQVRLFGLQASKLPIGRPNFEAWPLSDEAATALREHFLEKTLPLAYGGRRMDRHGRLLAHLYDADDAWIQDAILRRSMARVYRFSDNCSQLTDMLAIEGQARGKARYLGSPLLQRPRLDSLVQRPCNRTNSSQTNRTA